MSEHEFPGVQVVIWRNRGFVKLAQGSFGHVAVRLVGPHFQRGDVRSTYISWWPDRDAQAARHIGPIHARTAHRAEQRGYADDKKSELSDRALGHLRQGAIAREGQRVVDANVPLEQRQWIKMPDTKLMLPTIGQPGVSCGLDALAIARWWKVFNASSSAMWTTFGRNCAKITAAALHAGGASEFVPMPVTPLWRPTVIESWALRIHSQCHKKNERNGWITQLAHKSIHEHIVWDKLWDLWTWQYQSDGGKTHIRSSAFKKIDRLIPRYHEACKKKSFGAHDELPVKILNDILDALHEDLLANPNFNRKNTAALNLGKQCMDLLERWAKVPVEEGGTATAVVPVELAMQEMQQFEEFEEGVL